MVKMLLPEAGVELAWDCENLAETEPSPDAACQADGRTILPGLWGLGFSTQGVGVGLGEPLPPRTDLFQTAHLAGARELVAPPAITTQAAGGCGS